MVTSEQEKREECDNIIAKKLDMRFKKFKKLFIQNDKKNKGRNLRSYFRNVKNYDY